MLGDILSIERQLSGSHRDGPGTMYYSELRVKYRTGQTRTVNRGQSQHRHYVAYRMRDRQAAATAPACSGILQIVDLEEPDTALAISFVDNGRVGT
jgi:hypothetical protein